MKSTAAIQPSLAQTIIESKVVHDRNGNVVELTMHTSAQQGRFLQQFIDRENVSTVLEIGLAYGISALFICEALAKKKNPRFISIDCFQDRWQQIGLANLERAGFDKFTEFHKEYSHSILPQLMARGEKIDFAYSDSSKFLDVVITDACYIIQMLRVGGFFAFDDCSMTGVRRAVRYIATLPHMRVVGLHRKWPFSLQRKALCGVSKLFPFSLRRRIFREDIVETDRNLGVDGDCVVFEKISEDERTWDWVPKSSRS